MAEPEGGVGGGPGVVTAGQELGRLACGECAALLEAHEFVFGVLHGLEGLRVNDALFDEVDEELGTSVGFG